MSFRLAGDVQAVVHAVDEVDVGEARRSEENGIAGGLADVGMGSGIVEPEIGFDLDDAAGEGLAIQASSDKFAEEPGRDDVRRVEVEAAGQNFFLTSISQRTF